MGNLPHVFRALLALVFALGIFGRIAPLCIWGLLRCSLFVAGCSTTCIYLWLPRGCKRVVVIFVGFPRCIDGRSAYWWLGQQSCITRCLTLRSSGTAEPAWLVSSTACAPQPLTFNVKRKCVNRHLENVIIIPGYCECLRSHCEGLFGVLYSGSGTQKMAGTEMQLIESE